MLKFIVIDAKQASKVKKVDKGAIIHFINRQPAFKPNPEFVAKYDDILRRYGTHPNARKYAEQGSYYFENYRRIINRDSRAIGLLREMAVKAKTEPVYLVKETDKPDIDILMEMANHMVGAGVW